MALSSPKLGRGIRGGATFALFCSLHADMTLKDVPPSRGMIHLFQDESNEKFFSNLKKRQ